MSTTHLVDVMVNLVDVMVNIMCLVLLGCLEGPAQWPETRRGGARGGLGGAIAPPGLAIAPPRK